MTTWMELHQEMPRHKKILVLARLLKVDRRYAVGLMIDLWTWSLDNADSSGNLSGMTADDIEMALDWPAKKSGKLIEALLKANLLEDRGGAYALHDWSDYTGKLSERRESKREQDRKRQEKRRNKKCDIEREKGTAKDICHAPVTRDNAQNVTQKSCDVTQASRGNRGDYLTVLDRTELDLKEPVSRLIGNHSISGSARDNADAGAFEIIKTEFCKKIKPGLSGLDERRLAQLAEKYGKDRLLNAIDEACSKHGRSVNYIKAVLEGKDSGKKAETDLSDPERYKAFAERSASR